MGRAVATRIPLPFLRCADSRGFIVLFNTKRKFKRDRDHWRVSAVHANERARHRQRVIEAAHDALDDAGVAPGGLVNRILELDALAREARFSADPAGREGDVDVDLGYMNGGGDAEDPLDEGDPPSLVEQVDDLAAKCRALEVSLDEAEGELGELREENARLGLQCVGMREHEKHMASVLREVNEVCDEAGVPEGYKTASRVAMALSQRG